MRPPLKISSLVQHLAAEGDDKACLPRKREDKAKPL